MPSNSLFRRKKGTFPAAASAIALAAVWALSTFPVLSGDSRGVGFNGEAILQPGLPLEIVDVTAHINPVAKELGLNPTIANHSLTRGSAHAQQPVGEAFNQPSLPVELKHVSVHRNSVAKETWLHYTLINRSGEPLRELSVLILAFDVEWNPVGGQVPREGGLVVRRPEQASGTATQQFTRRGSGQCDPAFGDCCGWCGRDQHLMETVAAFPRARGTHACPPVRPTLESCCHSSHSARAGRTGLWRRERLV